MSSDCANDSLEKYKRWSKKKRMSDRIVLRKVFAVDSNTGLTMDPGNVLLTNATGGTTWTPMISALTLVGGPSIGNLPCTLSSFSTIGHTTAGLLSNITATYLASLCSLGGIIDSKNPTTFTAGLGTLGYVSVATLEASLSTLQGSPSTISTMAASLSTLGFVNLSSLSTFTSQVFTSTNSSIAALGSIGYVSSLSLISTVAGLGTSGYISSLNTPISFNSTVNGLGNVGYVSSQSLLSSVRNLGTSGYISTLSLMSSLVGLGNSGYVSTGHLVSTTFALSSLKANIRFDNVNTISIIGGNNVNSFTSIGNLIYVSTFFQSSLAYSGAQPGVPIEGKLINFVNMEFSTAVVNLDSFSSFIDHKSRITIEAYPTLAFTKLGTGANGVVMLPISTLLKYGNSVLSNTLTTSYLFAANTRTVLENGTLSVDSSNIFNQPIRLSIPQGTIVSLDGLGRPVYNYNQPYTLYHYMQNSVNNGALQNALHSNDVTPFFGSTGSLFVTVQNSV